MVLVLTCCVSADYTFEIYVNQDAVMKLKSKVIYHMAPVVIRSFLIGQMLEIICVVSCGKLTALAVDTNHIPYRSHDNLWLAS